MADHVLNPPVKLSEDTARDYKNLHKTEPTYKNVGGSCHGVAIHSDGTIYATNYDGDKIKVFRPDGTEREISNYALSKPHGIAVQKDMLYVTNQGNSTVSMIHTDGRVMGTIGIMRHPTGICVDGNKSRLLVVDCDSSVAKEPNATSLFTQTTWNQKHYIKFFTFHGKLIQSITFTGRAPSNVIVDSNDKIHVVFSGEISTYSCSKDINDSIHDDTKKANTTLVSSNYFYSRGNHDPEPKMIERCDLPGDQQDPTAVHIDPAGNRLVCACDRERNGKHYYLYVLDASGQLINFLNTTGGAGICMDKDQKIYIADNIKGRVIIY